MADRSGRPVRTGSERIRKLAQAALNADVTVEQVDTILEGLSETLEDLNNSTSTLDATLERFNDTINRINELAPRLHGVVDRMEASSGASSASSAWRVGDLPLGRHRPRDPWSGRPTAPRRRAG